MSVFSVPLESMDWVSRMYEIQKSLEIMRKSSFQVVIPYVHLLAGFLPRSLGHFIYHASCTEIPTQVDIIAVSNLAKPKESHSFNGHKIVYLMTSCGAVIGSNALHIFPVSCNGNMIVTVVGDVNVLESQRNVNLITESIYDQIQNFIEECHNKVEASS
jgi:hypothetical protein